ncbi:MAG: 2-oxoglutarate dehydrogenase complex dihydrolipoyllysine-residue succinyltransferase [Gammaproteobacteria bacterium]
MSVEVKVPNLPESVADATVVTWHKRPGDAVERDENLVDLETDKVVLEVPAPVSGVMGDIVAEDGATVVSGDLLASIKEGEVAAAPAASNDAPAAAEADTGSAADASGAAKLSPSVRRLVEENNLDAAKIKGTGNHGRITKADVQAFMSGGGAAAAPASPAPAAAAAPAPAAVAGARTEQRVPMTRMRARIAERMVEAQSTAAMLTSFNEIDLTEVKALRARYRDSFEKAHGVRLGFMSFFVRAAVEAMRKFPAINASVEGNDVVYHDYHDVGIAVSTPRGLVVPVLRNAEGMSFAQIEQSINAYALKAREGQIAIEDITGGTFTITNGGVFGSLMSTPILNPPQSAILGMHKIMDRPMVMNGEIVARPMMYIALTYDHRIIDGKEAVQFLVHIKDALEDPARLMLQV